MVRVKLFRAPQWTEAVLHQDACEQIFALGIR